MLGLRTLSRAGGRATLGALGSRVTGAGDHLASEAFYLNDPDGLGIEVYADGLGFDRTVWGYPGALFLGAGGYHHHVGTNTWAGRGARPPQPDDARLLEWTVELPAVANVRGAVESLARAGHAAAEWGDGAEAVAVDPWGTAVRLRAPAGSVDGSV